jgi:hypothetical protein
MRYTHYYERWASNQMVGSTYPVAVISLSEILNPCHCFSKDIHHCTLLRLGRAAATPIHAAHRSCRSCPSPHRCFDLPRQGHARLIPCANRHKKGDHGGVTS